MSATDELRHLLDEHGTEYEVDDAKTVKVTRWKAYGEWVSFIEYDTGETRFCIDARRFTPAQAIAATLGTETCKRIFIKDWLWKCSKCGSRHDSGHLFNYCPNCGRKVIDE